MNVILFNFALEYAIKRPRKRDRTRIEWDTSASGFCYGVNLLGDNIDIINKNK
jgi:hypothetical protein